MFWAWTAGVVVGTLLLLLVPVRLEVAYRNGGKEERLWLAMNLPGNWGRSDLELSPLLPRGKRWPSLGMETLLRQDRQATTPAREGKRRRPVNKISPATRFIAGGRLSYWLSNFKVLRRIWQHFLAQITCRRFRLFLNLGLDEPASSALLYGSSWAMVALIYQNLRRQAHLDFKRPELQIIPRFDASGWQADFNCIFTLKLGHIISAGLRSLSLLIRIVWQMRGAGPVARTSHRGADEDRHGKH